MEEKVTSKDSDLVSKIFSVVGIVLACSAGGAFFGSRIVPEKYQLVGGICGAFSGGIIGGVCEYSRYRTDKNHEKYQKIEK